MSVNLSSPDPQKLIPVQGIQLGSAQAGIRKSNRYDLLIITLPPQATTSGIFTTNRACAAPVLVAQKHLQAMISNNPIRALVINTGSANAGTGELGIQHAQQTCEALASLLSEKEGTKISAEQILPFSTGVILEYIPIEKLLIALPNCIETLNENNWLLASQTIMTTDIVPKAISKQVQMQEQTITITGIAKGSGMIAPNMATMLGFIFCSAKIEQSLLDRLIVETANSSFNNILVDGDMSTNDAFILVASGESREIKENSSDYLVLKQAIIDVAQYLAQAIVRDGEGATKFITIEVLHGKNNEECRKIAESIAQSPLVKTAFFASDPNLGRILSAVGASGIRDLDINQLDIYLDDVWVIQNGQRAKTYTEDKGRAVMQKEEISIKVLLNRGATETTLWTCDFSYDYVKINADYRS